MSTLEFQKTYQPFSRNLGVWPLEVEADKDKYVFHRLCTSPFLIHTGVNGSTSGNVNVCDINDDVKEALRKFRFRKSENNAALILKVDREKQKICIDELIENISIDELRESLLSHQPRYVIYSYKMQHADGRISYPMCFIYFTPRDSQMELQIMYAGTKLALQKEANLTRVYEIRELDELTEEWLQEKLSK